MKSPAGRNFIAHAIELAHRLPRVYARVLVGAVPVWQARRIAEQTLVLSAEAAAYVDIEIAPVADKIGPVVTERLVDEAISRFMPAYARELAERAEERRHVTVDRRQLGFYGTSSIHGELDLVDAYDLDDALARGAEFLKVQGDTDSLDVRRSKALGRLARGDVLGEATLGENVLYVHLDPDEPHATLENSGPHLVALDKVLGWLGRSDRVVVKPVIDLGAKVTSLGYQPSDSVREFVILRDRTCVFPGCTRNARHCDLDHIDPYDPEGPPGQTSSDNLACLCRHHHRLKTHGGWSYRMIGAGTYLWRSPHGYQYLRDTIGTQELTPRPVEPPGRG